MLYAALVDFADDIFYNDRNFCLKENNVSEPIRIDVWSDYA